MPQTGSRETQQALGLAAGTLIIQLWKMLPPEQHLRVKVMVLHEHAAVLRTLYPHSFHLRPWVEFVEKVLAGGKAELIRQGIPVPTTT